MDRDRYAFKAWFSPLHAFHGNALGKKIVYEEILCEERGTIH